MSTVFAELDVQIPEITPSMFEQFNARAVILVMGVDLPADVKFLQQAEED